jgi:hypothetical protein
MMYFQGCHFQALDASLYRISTNCSFPFQGSKIVRLVYLDEAGISSKEDEPFLTVAGIIVDADSKLNSIENHLERLVMRHIPAQHREGFVFHATELFNGGGKVFRREKPDFIGPHQWPLVRRLAIADVQPIAVNRRRAPLSRHRTRGAHSPHYLRHRAPDHAELERLRHRAM